MDFKETNNELDKDELDKVKLDEDKNIKLDPINELKDDDEKISINTIITGSDDVWKNRWRTTRKTRIL